MASERKAEYRAKGTGGEGVNTIVTYCLGKLKHRILIKTKTQNVYKLTLVKILKRFFRCSALLFK